MKRIVKSIHKELPERQRRELFMALCTRNKRFHTDEYGFL